MNLETYAEARRRRWRELVRANVVRGELPYEMFSGRHANVFFTDEARTRMVYVFDEAALPSRESVEWPPRPSDATGRDAASAVSDEAAFGVRPIYAVSTGVDGHFWLKYGEVDVERPLLEPREVAIDFDDFRRSKTLALAAALRRQTAAPACEHPLSQATEQTFETYLPRWKWTREEWEKHRDGDFDRPRAKRMAFFPGAAPKRLHDMVLASHVAGVTFRTFRELVEEDEVWFSYKEGGFF